MSLRSLNLPACIGTLSPCSSCEGLAAPRNTWSPSILPVADRNSATVWTPGSLRICLAMVGENGVPTAFETTKSAVRFSLTAFEVLALADWPMIDMVATSARPIISALAVAAVRRGLRSEFCVASCPTDPKSRA